MRTVALLAALVVVACGSPDRRAPGAAGAPATPSRSADQLALRVPRGGGVARVLAWPAGDSALWVSPVPVPPLRAVLAFDDEDGAFAAMDTSNHPVRIELRAGRVVPEKVRLAGARSADGWATFGISDKIVRRMTPAGESWSAAFDVAPSAVVPTPDGAVLIVVERTDGAHLYRARPPAPRIADSLTVADGQFGVATPLGDRLYLVTGDGLVGVRTRDLKASAAVGVGGTPRALAASPSGDRLFALTGDAHSLTVVDRYRDAIERTVPLPAEASGLRMDPLGRWLLVRAAKGDAVWVLALGTMALVATTTSVWREDLPAIATDGSVARVVGGDVVRWDPATQKELTRFVGGAADSWHLFSWNGFRAPTKEAEPVQFAASSADSALDSLRAPEPDPDGAARGVAPAALPVVSLPTTRGFIVSFAALLVAQAADSAASAINVGGEHARVVSTRQAGSTIYRVVLGPYASREEAVRVGRAARRDYWIIEGAP